MDGDNSNEVFFLVQCPFFLLSSCSKVICLLLERVFQPHPAHFEESFTRITNLLLLQTGHFILKPLARIKTSGFINQLSD
jgi:hypothetical protein